MVKGSASGTLGEECSDQSVSDRALGFRDLTPRGKGGQHLRCMRRGVLGFRAEDSGI